MRFCLSFVFLLLSACDSFSKSCNLMYAPDNLQVNFDPALTDDGEYLLEVEGGGSCIVRLPDDVSCEGDNTLSPVGLPDKISGLSFFGSAPESVHLTISLDGTVLSTHELTPTYTTTEPNGEGCGDTQSATVTVDPTGA